MQEKKDIFDRLMGLPGLNLFEDFYKKHKEVLLYLFFGGLTTIVSIASYSYCDVVLGMNPLIANVISWILAVLFAYVTNKIWVFDAQNNMFGDLAREIASFFLGRLFTLLVEEAILFMGITMLGLNSIAVKVVAQFIIIVLNYIISKLLVFRARA